MDCQEASHQISEEYHLPELRIISTNQLQFSGGHGIPTNDIRAQMDYPPFFCKFCILSTLNFVAPLYSQSFLIGPTQCQLCATINGKSEESFSYLPSELSAFTS